MVQASQRAYYEAINASSDQTDCAPFIDFMLGEILKALKRNKSEPRPASKLTDKLTDKLTEKEQTILFLVTADSSVTTSEMARQLGFSRQTISKILASLKQRNLLRRIGPDKGGQWEVMP